MSKTNSASTPKPNGRQLCPRYEKHLGREAFAPKSWSRPGKWCGECKHDHRLEKRGTKKAGRAPRKVSKKAPAVHAS
jgi:hypothetical protein